MSDPVLQLVHTLFQEEFPDLYYCVTCGNRSGIQLNHEPKRASRKVIGVLADVPFLTLWPQCGKCHNHKQHAEKFDHALLYYECDEPIGSSLEISLYSHGKMRFRRHEMQRRFVECLTNRRQYYKICKEYHV